MTKTEEEQAAAGQVETVTVPRLNPPSMADSNIESYFMSLDFWFAASGITAQHDNRKFNIVMAQVPPNKLTELRGILEAVPEVGKYTYIKAKLIEYFADSQQRRLQRVLSDMPLGDMKPSLLFNEMKRVAGTSLSDAPRVAPGSTDAPAVSSIAAMQGEIAELSRKLEQVLRFRNLRGESRSRSRSRRSYGPRERDSADGPCWYHRTYGNDAERCRKPCTFGQSSSPRLQ